MSYIVKDNKIYHRGEYDFINHSYKYENMLPRRERGEKLALNLEQIIKHYKPKYWYIENPKGSLIWLKYFKDLNGINNDINYGNYGYIVKKPTRFLSNIKLNFYGANRNRFKKTIKWEQYTNKISRSIIPTELLQDIFKSFESN